MKHSKKNTYYIGFIFFILYGCTNFHEEKVIIKEHFVYTSIYKSNWKDSLKIPVWGEPTSRYVIDSYHDWLFFADGSNSLYKIDLSSGKTVEIKNNCYQQNKNRNYGKTELVYSYPHLIHYTGGKLMVYNTHLEKVEDLGEKLDFSYFDAERPCYNDHTRLIDTVLLTKDEITVILSYCTITKDTLKFDKYLCLQ